MLALKKKAKQCDDRARKHALVLDFENKMTARSLCL